MGLRINTNLASLSAQRFLAKAQRQTDDSLRSLASGSRVDTPGKDAAGFAISQHLKAQIGGLKAAKHNAEGAQAFIQTAEGSLNEQNNILIRLRELSVQSASDTIGDNERGFLDTEFQQLVSEFDRIANVTRFGDKKLLAGDDKKFDFQVGANKGPENIITFDLNANTTSDEVGIEGLSVSDQDDAQDSLETIDEAITSVVGVRAEFGAVQSRLNYTIDNLASQTENISAAKSIIADTDYAEEVSKLAQGQLLQDVNASILVQANQDAGRVQRLLT